MLLAKAVALNVTDLATITTIATIVPQQPSVSVTVTRLTESPTQGTYVYFFSC
jgi:hypothetical protein